MANTETMSITAALVELKTLNSRIERAINDGYFVNVFVPNVSADSVEAMKTNCSSDMQSVMSLIARRDAIKRAIIASNAVTTVKVDGLQPKADGTDYTVAEIIELRANGTKYLKLLIETLTRRAQAARKNYEQKRYSVEQVAENIRQSIVSGANTDPSTNTQAKDAYDSYIAQNTPILVDPNDIIKTITSLNETIDKLGVSTDVALSIANANTTITVTY